jgi:RimJ/RimL family protein N-acetyltransferase
VNSEGAPNPGDFEVGWRLREDAWGQGYAKEAAIASLDLAFGKFGAPFVVALTVNQNEASQGLMKRLKMNRREDMDFQSTDMPAEINPVIVYRIDAEEWPAARAAALS